MHTSIGSSRFRFPFSEVLDRRQEWRPGLRSAVRRDQRPFLIDANAQEPTWSANGRELFYTSSVSPVLFHRKIATTPAAPLPASTAVELKRLPSDTFALNYD